MTDESIGGKASCARTAIVYPDDDIIAQGPACDIIDPDAHPTLPEIFRERVRRSGPDPAYLSWERNSQTWRSESWSNVAFRVSQMRSALVQDGLQFGDRAAICLANCVDWVVFDQACLAQGIVVVPLFVDDRAENIGSILRHTDSKLLFVTDLSKWKQVLSASGGLDAIERIVVQDERRIGVEATDKMVISLSEWITGAGQKFSDAHEPGENDLATIVYTSGTTGNPKGVMLSHTNMVSNAYAGLQSLATRPNDLMLSFLPLSHMFERTVGYYLTMMAGTRVAFNRSISELAQDLEMVRPTGLISVPRVFEKVLTELTQSLEDGPAHRRWLFNLAVSSGWRRFGCEQRRSAWSPLVWLCPILDRMVGSKLRARFGGRVRFVICGGARLAPSVSKTFIGLGLNLLQGYGLTECSPVLTSNTLTRNKPHTIGLPFRGVEICLGENDELLARGPNVMLGYWKDDAATGVTVSGDGWLSTGDQAAIDEDGFISITGRIKEIIVLANGEKVPPADMESSLCDDPLIEHAMVVGEGKPWLVAVISVNEPRLGEYARKHGFSQELPSLIEDPALHELVRNRLSQKLSGFPGYAFIREFHLTQDQWAVEGGELTPTMKLKRKVLQGRYSEQIAQLYQQGKPG